MTSTVATPEQIDFGRTGTSLPRVVRSEWTKLWSVRSTFWTLLSMIVVTAGFGVLASWGTTGSLDQMAPDERAALDPVGVSLFGIALGQLAIAVLGALIVSSEYSTGGIKTTLTAVPARMKVLTAKGIVFLVVALIAGIATSFTSFFLAMPFWSHHHLGVSLDDPGVLRAVIGGGLMLAGCGMFGFAVAAILRHTAGSITVAVALLLVLPLVTQALPGAWGKDVNKFITVNAGARITDAAHHPANQLGPWAGFTAFTLEWLVLLGIGAYLMRRRDA